MRVNRGIACIAVTLIAVTVVNVAPLFQNRGCFRAPLLKSYVIQWCGSDYPKEERKTIGLFQVIWLRHSADKLMDEPIIPTDKDVARVKRLAIYGDRVFGETESAYFVIDTHARKIDYLHSQVDYLELLDAYGIHNIQLRVPTDFTKGLPDNIIRPWNYQHMQGLLFLSDVQWSTLIEHIGLAMAITGGLAVSGIQNKGLRQVSRMLVAVLAFVFAFVVNALANFWLLGSGPDYFVGLLALPPIYAVAALFSGNIAISIDKRLRK